MSYLHVFIANDNGRYSSMGVPRPPNTPLIIAEILNPTRAVFPNPLLEPRVLCIIPTGVDKIERTFNEI